jgi:hypothetical protein
VLGGRRQVRNDGRPRRIRGKAGATPVQTRSVTADEAGLDRAWVNSGLVDRRGGKPPLAKGHRLTASISAALVTRWLNEIFHSNSDRFCGVPCGVSNDAGRALASSPVARMGTDAGSILALRVIP